MTQTTETPAPAQDVAINLDILEREGGPATPFRFTHLDKTYALIDPQEVDWQDLLSGFRNPAMLIRYAMPTEYHRDFFSSAMPAWKMNAVMDAYQKHFGLPDLGNASALPR